jgi:hypothetical protein
MSILSYTGLQDAGRTTATLADLVKSSRTTALMK